MKKFFFNMVKSPFVLLALAWCAYCDVTLFKTCGVAAGVAYLVFAIFAIASSYLYVTHSTKV